MITKFELKNLNGFMFVNRGEIDNSRWCFYDENGEFIDTLYGTDNEIKKDITKISKIKHISELVDIGLCLNMMYGRDLNDLLETWNDYIQEEFEPYTLEEFKENIPYNKVGDFYFVVNYTEI